MSDTKQDMPDVIYTTRTVTAKPEQCVISLEPNPIEELPEYFEEKKWIDFDKHKAELDKAVNDAVINCWNALNDAIDKDFDGKDFAPLLNAVMFANDKQYQKDKAGLEKRFNSIKSKRGDSDE